MKPTIFCAWCAKQQRAYHEKPRVAYCLVCRRCSGCGCMCTHCHKCQKQVPQRPSRFCAHCRTCKSCCTCRHMAQYTPLPAPRVSDTYHINTLPRTLGLELELADWGKLRNEGTFNHLEYEPVRDWSVQPSGQEMVIHPLRGDEFLRAMAELAEQLYRTDATVNQTCAYHVHVGSSDLSYWDLRKILRIYEMLEGEIYDHLILPHRRDVPEVTHYCQMLTKKHVKCERCSRYDQQYPRQRKALIPLRDTIEWLNNAKNTFELKQGIINMLYGPMEGQRPRDAATWLQTRKNGRYEWSRYVGLNLHAWMYRGTLEFRMKEASTDLEDLTAWPLWCGWFVQACTRIQERRTMRESFSLLKFTDEFMPRWITDWVQKKICTQVKPVMATGPMEGRTGDTITARPPHGWTGTITNTAPALQAGNGLRWGTQRRIPTLEPLPEPLTREEE